ncbi:MAG: hypothetical protein AAGK17_02365 [Pseudomonadota bacterium]
MTITQPTPWHLWVVGGVSLLWNAGGVTSYTMTKLGRLESMGMPPEQIAYYSSFPVWATAFWALGVWGCVFGSLALLLRSRFAVTLFGISIIGLIGTTIFQWGVSDLPAELKTAGHIAFAAAIWIITFALFFYAKSLKAKNVLR